MPELAHELLTFAALAGAVVFLAYRLSRPDSSACSQCADARLTERQGRLRTPAAPPSRAVRSRQLTVFR